MPNALDRLFENMDRWRHLPSYQLERRVDVFFSVFMKDVVEAHVGVALKPVIVPEFPLRHGSLDPNLDTRTDTRARDTRNRSSKVDYLLVSQDLASAFFVELKTDMRSRDPKQDAHMRTAQRLGLRRVLKGVCTLAECSTEAGKYRALLGELAALGLVESESTSRFRLSGADPTLSIVYVQPVRSGVSELVIDFAEFATRIESSGDEIGRIFATHLRRWMTEPGA